DRDDHRRGGDRMHLSRSGSGRVLLVLHHDIGTPDRLAFYDRLAERFTVLVPQHPGWGRSQRPSWMRSVRDLAAMHQWLLAELGVTDCSLVGLGFGGWIAAEMASLAPRQFHRLVLVGAHGIKPPEGDILDQAIISYLAYPQAGFHNQEAFHRVFGQVSTDQLEQWDIAREMCFRVAWKPYMYSQTRPYLLGGVRTPALVVWGDDDRIVPRSAADAYVRALRQARLEIGPGCGHFVDMEKPDELAGLVAAFVNAS
ncbi:MAG TPA: alpha/beta hydrolase, partial [Acetobacteraceae bacterium]|nr:alpha/beta hydrolase [Acetobacteraceae bacterium]